MSELTRNMRILQILNSSLGHHDPMAGGSSISTCSNVSLEALDFDIKRKAYHGVEVFDAEVAKLAKDYYGFEGVYRDNRQSTFVTNVKTIVSMTSKNPLVFREKIRLFDDRTNINRLRAPVGHAYLNIFSKTPAKDLTVDEEEFWKCFDFRDLGVRLHNSVYLKNVIKLLVVKNNISLLDKFTEVLVSLNEAVTKMSTDYEMVVKRIIDAYQRGETISLNESIDLNQSEIVLCGVVLKPYIANVLNRKWYNNHLTSQLGNSIEDLKTLLQEPREALTPNRGENPEILDNLNTIVTDEGFEDRIRNIQRVVSSTVDQVVLSSRRLTRLSEHLQGFSEKDNEDSYNTALRDISVLIAIYSGSLLEVLKFTTLTAYNLHASFKEVGYLANRVADLNLQVNKYIEMRK